MIGCQVADGPDSVDFDFFVASKRVATSQKNSRDERIGRATTAHSGFAFGEFGRTPTGIFRRRVEGTAGLRAAVDIERRRGLEAADSVWYARRVR